MTLSAIIAGHSTAVRLASFLGIFLVMALWEVLSPRRTRSTSKRVRWSSNLILVVLNSVLVRLIFPAAAVGAAALAAARGWGLLNQTMISSRLSEGERLLVALIALDLTIYLQHVMLHAVPVLWRVHRVHHADLDLDVTTGLRFHPLEILLSVLIKIAAVVLLGASAAAVVLFEVLLNATSMFNHGNVRLPAPADRVLRWLLVTPDMHRVHHSMEEDETNSNFGFNLTWWDRLFGTYRSQPRAGNAMTVGIRTFRRPRWCTWLPGMLAIPFIGDVAGYAINRRSWEPRR